MLTKFNRSPKFPPTHQNSCKTRKYNVKLIFSKTEPNIVAGDKLLPGTNPGFLKSEENVKLHTYVG